MGQGGLRRRRSRRTRGGCGLGSGLRRRGGHRGCRRGRGCGRRRGGTTISLEVTPANCFNRNVALSSHPIDISLVIENVSGLRIFRSIQHRVVLDHVVRVAVGVRERSNEASRSLGHGEGTTIDRSANGNTLNVVLVTRVSLEVIKRVPLEQARSLPGIRIR